MQSIGAFFPSITPFRTEGSSPPNLLPHNFISIPADLADIPAIAFSQSFCSRCYPASQEQKLQ
jgi:hypothetical protein